MDAAAARPARRRSLLPQPTARRSSEARGKQQWLALRLRSAAASRAHAPVAASTLGPSAEEEEEEEEWRESRQQRRRRRRERRSSWGVGGGGPAGTAGGVTGDVWCTCTPGIPFAAEASSVDCVMVRHHTATPGRRGEAERRHREGTAEQRARRVTMHPHRPSNAWYPSRPSPLTYSPLSRIRKGPSDVLVPVHLAGRCPQAVFGF